ncbi:MAG: glycosyltransferase [Pseudomonadota bacterium]
MKIAIVAPSPVPFVIGGAEKLWWGLLAAMNQVPGYEVELLKLPSPEQDFWSLMESYRRFSRLNLDHFDLVISTKYPAWMVSHRHHRVYLQHKLRGLYDAYALTGLPTHLESVPGLLRPLIAQMDASRQRPEELGPFFDRLFALRDHPSLPVSALAFPGPLSRRIVHFLDAIALSPTAIRRYFAISRNVAQRADYFPEGVKVTSLHHPSDLTRYENHGYDYLFTASRLSSPKRIGLLVEAFRQVPAEIEFRIAGDGEEAASLRQLAGNDRRIRFLGRITDAELIEQYAGALFVPFVPYDEDYGLITLEAMQSGKAVLTSQDAGGVNELVEDGVTGRSVAATVTALAQAMTAMILDPEGTRRMGQAARERVASIAWPAVVETLLGESSSVERVVPRRPRILVAVDFPVYPPRGGGQLRIACLYRELARIADVTLLTLTEDAGQTGESTPAPGLREVRIAKSRAHRRAADALERQLRASVNDIATMRHGDKTPAYGEALRQALVVTDLVIASHPYLYPVLAANWPGPLWYEAHNVEFDMKSAVLANTPGAQPYLDQVRTTEAACCQAAQRIMVCSTEDASRLASLYAISEDRFIKAPNGVDTRATPFVTLAARLASKARLGLAGRQLALFVGSWHQPNIEAVSWLKGLAHECPEVDFLVVGSVCGHPVLADAPANCLRLGVLETAQLRVVLSAVDMALNPMRSGSGTNLKVLEYAAAGIPILMTPFGNRGLGFIDGETARITELPQFAEVLRECFDHADLAGSAAAARSYVEKHFDWRIIADRLGPEIIAATPRR